MPDMAMDNPDPYVELDNRADASEMSDGEPIRVRRTQPRRSPSAGS